MRRWSLLGCRVPFIFLSLICVLPTHAVADVDNERSLRNALHFYLEGDYDKSKKYFMALLESGDNHLQITARRYLNRPELKRARYTSPHATVPTPVPTSRKESSLIEDTDTAPEREATSRRLSAPKERNRFSGWMKQEIAERIGSSPQLSKFRTVAASALTGEFTEGLSYKVSGRLWYDGVFDLTHHYPRSVSDDQKTDAQIRDTYIDASHNNWDIRVGKQQIVWGEALGLFYADQVNAKDLREFVLPDFDFIRIPEWATDIEYSHADFHAEAIWLPWPTMSRVARPGAEYAFALHTPPAMPVTLGREQSPRDSLGNGEVGGRLGYVLGGWDIGAFHLRTWDKLPVYITSIDPSAGLVLTATHPRLTLDGFTVSKDIEGYVFKGEAVYYSGKYFQTTDPAIADGILRKDFVDYVAGLDHTFGDKWSVSAQMSQRLVRGYETSLYQQKALRTLAAVGIRHPLWDDRIDADVLVIRDLTTPDMMTRPRLIYKMTSHWRIMTGLDMFSGRSDGLFGEFRNRSRGYFEIRYDF